MTTNISMTHGIFVLSSLPPWKTPQEVLKGSLNQVVLADELGFQHAWIAEHNAREYGIVGSAHLFVGIAAGATKRIRLGTACTRVPVHHPLHLAEDLALLDQITDGRIDWGIGRGYDGLEFRSYGMAEDERDDRYAEILEIVFAIWESGSVKYEGKYYSLPHAGGGEDGPVQLFPPVLQKPHPPVYEMVSGSDRSIISAATSGHAFIVGPVVTPEQIREKVALYRQEAARAGFSDDEVELILARSSQLKPMHVADTVEKAAEEFKRGFMWYMDRRDNRGMFGFSKWEAPYMDYVKQGAILFGPAEKLVEDIVEFRAETGLGGIVSWFDCVGQPYDQIEYAMREYARLAI